MHANTTSTLCSSSSLARSCWRKGMFSKRALKQDWLYGVTSHRNSFYRGENRGSEKASCLSSHTLTNRLKDPSSPAVAFPLPTTTFLDTQKRWMFPRTVRTGAQASGLEPVQKDRIRTGLIVITRVLTQLCPSLWEGN